MDRFNLPDGLVAHHVEAPAQMLGVDSGLMALVDPTHVDEFLDAVGPRIDGAEAPEAAGFTCTRTGFMCGTGGDDVFPFTVFTRDNAVHAVEVCFDDYDGARDRWIPAGVIPVPSGTLLIGDPGLLTHYVPDPFQAPFEVFGVWAALALPGPGWVAVHVLKERAKVEGPNLVLRVEWIS